MIEQKELLMFDRNFVHAGGDNNHSNPRIFASFGRTFNALDCVNHVIFEDNVMCATHWKILRIIMMIKT